MVAHRWFSRPVHSAALPYFRARVSLPGAPLNRTRNCATPGPSGCRVALEESTLVTLTGFGPCRVAKRGNPDTLRPKTLLAHSAGGRAGSESTLVTLTGFGLCCVTYRAKPDTLRPKTVFGGPGPAPAPASPATDSPRPGPSIPRCPRPCAGCNRPAPCAAPDPAAAPAG